MPPPDPTTAAEGWNFRTESQVCSRRPQADRATAWPALCPVFPPSSPRWTSLSLSLSLSPSVAPGLAFTSWAGSVFRKYKRLPGFESSIYQLQELRPVPSLNLVNKHRFISSFIHSKYMFSGPSSMLNSPRNSEMKSEGPTQGKTLMLLLKLGLVRLCSQNK